MAAAPPQALGGTAIKPAGWDRTGFEAFKYMIYNPENGEILTRTPQSWAKITGFYLVYYSCLAAFWIGCLNIFFMTLPEGKPKWILDASIIGTNPGVGRRPGPDDLHIDSSIISLKVKDKDKSPSSADGEGVKNVDWAKRMEMYMGQYKNNSNLVRCDGQEKGDGGNCIFDTAVLGECENYPYGYLSENGEMVQPCIYLKFNKIWDWKPRPIDPESLDNYEYSMMTEDLKEKIRAAGDDINYVWMDCRGRFAADKEALVVKYFPENQGIPMKYFPYSGGNYHTPLVAIKIETSRLLPTQIGQLIHVECRSWFEGVKHDAKEMAGLARFEIFLRK